MTQAINLALLGNNVNASGQVSLTAGVSGTLPVANGGTGTTTLAANNVLLGNGTSAPQVVAPGASGNLLTSNGTTWTSATPTPIAPTTAQVLNATAAANVGDVGTYGAFYYNGNLTQGATVAGSTLRYTSFFVSQNGGLAGTGYATGTPSGTWRVMGKGTISNSGCGIFLAFGSLFLRIS